MPDARARFRRRGREGAAMVEAGMVIILICLLVFGILQLSRLATSRAILDHAAIAAARAKAVGFNDFMVYKVYRVAAIPNAGAMESPDFDRGPGQADLWAHGTVNQQWSYALRATPASPQHDVEQSRIPLYLGAESAGQLRPILDYEDWDTIHLQRMNEGVDDTIEVTVGQDVPLKYPMHRAFIGADEVQTEGEVEMDSHYRLYLQ